MSANNGNKRKIFVSYRRTDNPDFAQRVRDHFVMKYGRDNVFMDFDSIQYFSDFANVIQQKIHESDVVIAVIGPQWMDLMREKATRFNEKDYVRFELELAIKLNKIIAPICIKGAKPPSSEELPDSLKEMMKYNFAEISSNASFYETMDKIMESVEDSIHSLEQKMKSQDVYESINSFYEAVSAKAWSNALSWLEHISKFEHIPLVFNLSELQSEIEHRIREENATFEKNQQAEKEYEVLRRMAANKNVDRVRIWKALQTLWQTFPDYDPDGLAKEFRQPLPNQLSLEFIHKPLELWKSGFNGWQAIDWSDEKFQIRCGLYDDVNSIQQLPLSINLMEGNVYIAGTTGAGKSTALKTMIMSLITQYMPNHIHLYLIDHNVQLSGFSEFFHAGAYITFDETERIDRLVALLYNEIELRRNLFRQARQENIRSYNLYSTDIMPHIVIFIDDWDEFYPIFRDAENSILNIVRNGRIFGIHFVVAATHAITSAINEFTTKLVLKQSDKNDYRVFLGTTQFEEIFVAGRGYLRQGDALVQFQIANPIFVSESERLNGIDTADKLNQVATQMRNLNNLDNAGEYATKIESLMDYLPLSELNNRAENLNFAGLPIGINDERLDVFTIPLSAEKPHVFISGSTGSGKTETLKTIIQQIIKYRHGLENTQLVLVDMFGKLLNEEESKTLHTSGYLAHYIKDVSQFESYIEWLLELIESDSSTTIYTIIDNYEELSKDKNYVGGYSNSANYAERIVKLVKNANKKDIHFVLAINNMGYNERDALKNLVEDSQYGIALDVGKLEQRPFNSRIPKKYRNRNKWIPKGRAFEVNNGIVSTIQLATSLDNNAESSWLETLSLQTTKMLPKSINLANPERTLSELTEDIQQTLHELLDGGWLGEDADKFFQTMTNQELPRLYRIQELYIELSRYSEQLLLIKQQIEDDSNLDGKVD